jgi:hypothetical protein
MSVGANFVAAGLTDQSTVSPAELELKKKRAQRRVIGMAIEAALAEDDFETAYSYVVNWLDTSQASAHNTDTADDDDIAWRAALAAGKHKSPTSSNPSANTRRLDQRLDLLSQALLLAPSHALPEILSAWRKCEEEMASLLAAEAADEGVEDQDVPGAYIEAAPLVQARREVGRGANEEAPMGLFDVARGAASAFSKSAFPLHGSSGGQKPIRVVETAGSDSGSFDDHGRVRKRDQLANVGNVVTGGLASGVGWILGANPVQPKE